MSCTVSVGKDKRPRNWFLQLGRMVPMLLVMGTIFFLSNQPGSTYQRFVFFDGEDKIVHCCLYGTLALTVAFAFARLRKRWGGLRFSLLVVLVTVGYGMTDEFHQYFIPGRSTSLADLAADCTGAVLCCIVVEVIRRRWMRLKRGL